MEVIQVQPRDFYLHYIYVPIKGTSIRWNFTTKKNRIAFGLYHRLGSMPITSSSDIVLIKSQQLARSNSIHYQFNFNELNQKTEDSSSCLNQNLAARSRARSKSIATEKLNDKSNLVELIPIEQVDSSKAKIEGSYTVHEPGNYVIVFDNTFSKNTPKIVTFSVALVDPTLETSSSDPIEISGWLLKKKRKKLQGWAKRWFELSKTGILSYGTSPTSLTRGSTQIVLATISLNPQQRMFHIDSGSSLFHIRCPTDQDYERWISALKLFKKDESLHDHLLIPDIKTPVSTSDDCSIIYSKVLAGLRNAESIASNLKLYHEEAMTLESTIQIESGQSTLTTKYGILDNLAVDQIKQWKEVQLSMESILNNNKNGIDSNEFTTHNRVGDEGKKLTRISSNIGQFLSNPDNPSINDSSSFRSEAFFDAESILSIEEEDDDNFVNRIDSSPSVSLDEDDEYSTTESQTELKTHKKISIDGPVNFYRRQILPAVASKDGVSALSVFRKNIGKDLSQVAMPVTMNEPLSLLQKACEDMEYSELLDKASCCADSMERLMYITAFAISTYSSSQWRTGKKPFNPMMSETYECVRPDKGFRFISEKVSHRPLIIASHAESNNYQYWQCTKIKSKFWGKSMEFLTEGTFHISLCGEHYTFTKPSSWIRNMIAGEKYLEHVGELKVVNQTTSERAIVTFKEGTGGGMFSAPKERNHVVGWLYNSQGEKSKRIVGKWSDQLAEDVNLDGNTLSVLWKANSPPADSKKYYGFSSFAIELNEITPVEKGKLPKTDSRVRPDQRLYENGRIEEADEEKLRIEDQQRKTRAKFESEGTPWSPLWFRLEEDSFEEPDFVGSTEADTLGRTWKFSGEYWKVREIGQWPTSTPDLW